MFFIIIAVRGALAGEIAWEIAKDEIGSYEWSMHSDTGPLLPNGNQYIISASSYVLNAASSCDDDTIRLLYKIAKISRDLYVSGELGYKAAQIGCSALIEGTKCETLRVKSHEELSTYRYIEPARPKCFFPRKGVSTEYLADMKKLSHQYSTARYDRCNVSIDNQRYVWRNCYDIEEDMKIDEILRMLSTLDEVNNLPAFKNQWIELNDGIKPFSSSRFGVAKYLIQHSGLSTDLLLVNNARFSLEIYNSLPNSGSVCYSVEGARVCSSKQDFITAYDNPQSFKKIISIRDQIKASGFDFSQLDGQELLFARMIAAGMIDEPDQPPSVSFARYPPPLVPNWSEYFEADRYTAETGIVVNNDMGDAYSQSYSITKNESDAYRHANTLQENESVSTSQSEKPSPVEAPAVTKSDAPSSHISKTQSSDALPSWVVWASAVIVGVLLVLLVSFVWRRKSSNGVSRPSVRRDDDG